MTPPHHITEADFADAMRRARKRLREYKRPVPVLTVSGVEEARCAISAALQHATPEGAAALASLMGDLDAKLAKTSKARAAGRAEHIRWLFDRYYGPRGFSVRRAARDIQQIAEGLSLGDSYPAEPHRTVKQIILNNGGKVPSFGTIKKDLEHIDLS